MIIPPYTEQLVIQYLRDHLDVEALAEGRVYSRVPADPTYPLVTAFRFGGTKPVRSWQPKASWIDRARLQIDCWGEEPIEANKASTHLLAVTVNAALEELSGITEYGVVTDTEIESGPSWDEDLISNRPRYRSSLRIDVHPVEVNVNIQIQTVQTGA